ncbi:heme biosynthesis protein HemY [Novispirillum sp. DQ9]|uniref:heme biosynthesis protein HemY n=1 Tax=Novispirillum sp. DQ9 TaxID=3398612 RepID=UPI003C79ACBE
MIRLIAFVVLVGLLVAGAVWMAENPGAVTVYWLGWRIDTSVPLLLLALALLVGLFWLIRGIIATLFGLPGAFGRRRRERRRRKGLAALGDGFAAVIAGDTYSARKKAAEAEDALKDDSATTLLLARAALLGDDPRRARDLNQKLLSRRSTEIAGLRGLMDEALSEGRREEATGYAARAFERNPRAAWAGRALFEAQAKGRQWDAALATLETARKNGIFTAAEAARRKATVFVARCDEALSGGQSYEATRLAKKAVEADADLPPARIRLARALAAEGNAAKAASVIEDAWRRGPTAELAAVHASLWGAEDPLKRCNRAVHLAESNPEHLESRLMVAEASLDAQLWGQARARLKPLVDAGVRDSRMARLMARLEEGERGNLADALRWMRQAADVAGHEPEAWRCTACGTALPQWHATCPACDSFATVAAGSSRALVTVTPEPVPAPPVGRPAAAE